MSIYCDACEGHIVVHPPRGRWLISPALFQAQNPIAVPLGYNVMLTDPGTKTAECNCGIHYEVLWEIVWSLTHDDQGTPVRYLMAQPIPFKPCPTCGHHWTKQVDFMPTQIDARNPCQACIEQCRKVGGDWMFR